MEHDGGMAVHGRRLLDRVHEARRNGGGYGGDMERLRTGEFAAVCPFHPLMFLVSCKTRLLRTHPARASLNCLSTRPGRMRLTNRFIQVAKSFGAPYATRHRATPCWSAEGSCQPTNRTLICLEVLRGTRRLTERGELFRNLSQVSISLR